MLSPESGGTTRSKGSAYVTGLINQSAGAKVPDIK